MQYIVVLPNALPSVTGPSFVVFERVRYFAAQKIPVDVFLPWPRIDWTGSFAEYTTYLRTSHNIERTGCIRMYTLESTYSNLLKWYSITRSGTINLCSHINAIPESTQVIVIMEGPICHFCTGRRVASTLKTMVPQSTNFIHVVHTDYPGIIPSLMVLPAKIVVRLTLPRESNHNYVSLYDEKSAIYYPVRFAPLIHFINPLFFNKSVRTRLPTRNTVYFIGKIDYAHKNISRILNWTTEVCDIHIYESGINVGRLQNGIARNPRIIYHGNISHDDQLTDETFINHKCYVSLSTCEGYCTATAEALAMNKYALVADVSCNYCFKQSSNCVLVGLNKPAYIAPLNRILATAPVQETCIEYMSRDIACQKLAQILRGAVREDKLDYSTLVLCLFILNLHCRRLIDS